jgi:hypothetical protein
MVKEKYYQNLIFFHSKSKAHSLTNDDKEESSKKMKDDREIWKRMIYQKKSQYIEDFNKIEFSYNKNYL